MDQGGLGVSKTAIRRPYFFPVPACREKKETPDRRLGLSRNKVKPTKLTKLRHYSMLNWA